MSRTAIPPRGPWRTSIVAAVTRIGHQLRITLSDEESARQPRTRGTAGDHHRLFHTAHLLASARRQQGQLADGAATAVSFKQRGADEEKQSKMVVTGARLLLHTKRTDVDLCITSAPLYL